MNASATMRNYALCFLLLICIMGSSSCSAARKHARDAWQKEQEKRHTDKVNRIVNDVMNKLKKYADEMVTPSAMYCYEQSTLKLTELLKRGENDVKSCIDKAGLKDLADQCCYKVESKVGEEVTKIALIAVKCIDMV